MRSGLHPVVRRLCICPAPHRRGRCSACWPAPQGSRSCLAQRLAPTQTPSPSSGRGRQDKSMHGVGTQDKSTKDHRMDGKRNHHRGGSVPAPWFVSLLNAASFTHTCTACHELHPHLHSVPQASRTHCMLECRQEVVIPSDQGVAERHCTVPYSSRNWGAHPAAHSLPAGMHIRPPWASST